MHNERNCVTILLASYADDLYHLLIAATSIVKTITKIKGITMSKINVKMISTFGILITGHNKTKATVTAFAATKEKGKETLNPEFRLRYTGPRGNGLKIDFNNPLKVHDFVLRLKRDFNITKKEDLMLIRQHLDEYLKSLPSLYIQAFANYGIEQVKLLDRFINGEEPTESERIKFKQGAKTQKCKEMKAKAKTPLSTKPEKTKVNKPKASPQVKTHTNPLREIKEKKPARLYEDPSRKTKVAGKDVKVRIKRSSKLAEPNQ